MTGFFQSIITIVLFLAILGILVVIHELGHFVTARLAGRPRPRVRPRLPAAGQGPARQGRDALHAQLAADRRLREARGRGRQRRRRSALLRRRSRWLKKMVILAAGVAMNVLLAFVIFTGHRVARLAAHGHPLLRGRAGLAGRARPASSLATRSSPSTGSATSSSRGPTRPRWPALAGRPDGGPDRGRRRRRRGATSRSRCATRRPSTPGRAPSGSRASAASGRPTSMAPRPPTRCPTAIAIGADQTVGALRPDPGRPRQARASRSRPTRRRRHRSPDRSASRCRSATSFWNVGPILTLYVAGILSANLALVNILPFPPLDGGRMLMITLKRLFGAAHQPPRRAADLRRRHGVPVRVHHLGDRLRHHPQPHRGHARRPMTSDPTSAQADGAGRRVSVDVGGVLVGSAHPVVVQSMTNTDTADADATAIQVARTRPRGLAAGPRHGQHRGSRRGRPGDGPQGPRPGRGRADHRRLPLQRPQAARRVPGDGRRCSRSTGSIRAMSARSATTSTSPRSSGSPSRTTSRCGSASTGARSTRPS